MLAQGSVNLLRPVTSYKLLALGADGLTVGLVTAVYALVPLVAALALARRADRTRRLLRAAGAATVVLGTGGALLALADGVLLVVAGTMVLGVGHLLFTLAGQAAIARYSRDSELDLGFGWFTASYSLGQALGPLLGGALVGPAAGSAGDRLARVDLALWVGTGVALLALPLLLAPLAVPPVRAQARAGEEDLEPRTSMRGVLRLPGVAPAMSASLTLLAALDILTAFLPVVGERAGVPPVVVGALLAVRGAAAFVARVSLPLLTGWLSRTSWVLVSLVGAALALALPPLVLDRTLLAAVCLAVGGFFLGLGQPLTMTLISTGVPTQWRSQALAVRLVGNRVGQVAVPLLAGLVAAPLGPAAAIWLSCALLGGSGAYLALAHRRR
ncbi:MFS transporter [Serinicoccus marinus]|uniref:MFS transporter n=1 Tax=Serinicoccus marinus TaxID=247333 RepID=UPI002490318A|nr:MFS transporter [Serinicoccus marinus]